MTTHARRSVSPFSRRFALVTLTALAAGLLSACTEGVDVSSLSSDKVRVPLRAYYAGPAAAVNAAASINKIRVTVRVEPGGTTFGPFEIAVVDAPEWTIPIELPLTSAANVIVTIELMTNDVVEYSGRVGPFRVVPGAAPTPAPPVPVFPGPVANLDITAVTISGSGGTVIEGGTIQLRADVTGGGPGTRVTWTSLDPTLATVDANGLVTTRLPGTARIMATAGPQSATASVTINRRMSRVEVAPATQSLTSLGQEATFSARVLDPRNAEFTGVAIEWSSSDPSVAAHVGGGRFRAVKAGSVTITARVAGNASLAATGTLRITQDVAAVTVSPGSAAFESLGATATFAAKATDAGGNEVPGTTFTWSSSNPGVATVNASGVVTAVSNGSATITATSGGKSASAGVTVAQKITGITISPGSGAFTAINQQIQFTAAAVDARGNPVAGTAITWRSANSGVATVDATGRVTATGRGSTSITASGGTAEASVGITVTQVPGRVVITPTSATIGVGGTVQFTASVRDAGGFPIPGAGAAFSSRNPEIATTTNGGLVTGVSAGTATIQASAGAITNTVTVTVTAGSTGPIRVAGVGCNCGNNAADMIFSSGDLAGTIERLTVAQFNAIATADLRSRYDVIIITWATSSSLNADWETRLKPYIEAGGGVYWEDPNNLGDIAAIVPGALSEPGGYPIRRVAGVNVPGLTDGINNNFVNNHIGIMSHHANLSPFLEADGIYNYATSTSSTRPVGLYGAFGSGRFVLSGPDHDYHAYRGSSGAVDNQYKLLINILRWVSKRVPAGLTGARPVFDVITPPLTPALQAERVELDRRQQQHLERIRAEQAPRVNKGSN